MDLGFPAHAGMDRCPHGPAASRPGLPRTRGDGPNACFAIFDEAGASPHTRGWTPIVLHKGVIVKGFPAHAGMDRRQGRGRNRSAGLPRTRGDGPHEQPAPLREEQASPHTRGWTADRGLLREGERGFPAHAGMDRWTAGEAPGRSRLPRTRGDGPSHAPRPAPRRGASPHTRGWTPARRLDLRLGPGFPAHAGMDPSTWSRRSARSRLPRTRGDGPLGQTSFPELARASPHTRGWTRGRWRLAVPGPGFPAHAGMDRRRSAAAADTARLPRTRGDGPCPDPIAGSQMRASPHTRGWT